MSSQNFLFSVFSNFPWQKHPFCGILLDFLFSLMHPCYFPNVTASSSLTSPAFILFSHALQPNILLRLAFYQTLISILFSLTFYIHAHGRAHAHTHDLPFSPYKLLSSSSFALAPHYIIPHWTPTNIVSNLSSLVNTFKTHIILPSPSPLFFNASFCLPMLYKCSSFVIFHTINFMPSSLKPLMYMTNTWLSTLPRSSPNLNLS